MDLSPSSSPTIAPVERHVWLVALVVAVGTIASALAISTVNVALDVLGRDLHASIDTIQWTATAYLLGLAAVIPASGWTAQRFGARRVYLVAGLLFMAASIACGLAWSAESLIGLRVLQGLAGGMLMPVGQMMLATAAGPSRMGRVMSVLGIPMALGPALGPVLGGFLVDSLSWHWIFFVNVPLSLATFVLGRRYLPATVSGTASRLDARGLLLLSTGAPLLVYGLAQVSTHGAGSPGVLVPALGGLALIACFAAHALHRDHPLLDVRLYANRGFAAAAVTTFCIGAALYGGMILLPLYFQIVRGESALGAGLLLLPQAAGMALAMPLAGRLTDRLGGGRVAVGGLAVMIAGTLPLAAISDTTSYVVLGAVLLVRGIGIGSSMMPTMVAAYAVLRPRDVPDATPQLNVLQRVGGSIGTAILATVLHGRLGSAAHAGPHALATAFAGTYWWAIAVTAVAVVPAFVLLRIERRPRTPAEHLRIRTLEAEAEAAA
jgi:EmrB/QacA subfamily drug resistance transporter